VLNFWSIRRATGFGAVAGLAALILWPVYAGYQERTYWFFVAALAVAAFCGLSILLMTGIDMMLRRRGKSVRPIRAFDIIFGTALLVPSLLQLNRLMPL
jgi:hypothetical protein